VVFLPGSTTDEGEGSDRRNTVIREELRAPIGVAEKLQRRLVILLRRTGA
jgi:hypothetical protein